MQQCQQLVHRPDHTFSPPYVVLLRFLSSVNAFFDVIGQEWRSLFSEIRTREFKYVKPDKRLLLDVAQVGRFLQTNCEIPLQMHCRAIIYASRLLLSESSSQIAPQYAAAASTVPTFMACTQSLTIKPAVFL